MPSKGNRFASKQASLHHKKKKNRGPSGIPEGTFTTQREQITTGSPTETKIATEVTQPQISPARPESRSRVNVYNFVGSEIRRILALSATIMAALVAITFFIK